MRLWLALCLLLTVVGCGRFGFDGAGEDATWISSDDAVVRENDYAITPIEAGYAIAWAEYPAGSEDVQVMIARTDHEGALLGAPRVAVGTELDPGVHQIAVFPRPDLGIDILFVKDNDVCVARLDSLGTVINLYEWDSGGTVSGARFIAAPDGYAMIFSRIPGSYRQVYFQRLSITGELIGAALQIDPSSAHQVRFDGVFNGEYFIIAWHDYTGSDRIRYARISTDSMLLEAPRPVFDDGGVQSRPEIAWTGERTLVAFGQDGMVKGIGIEADGTTWAEPIDLMLYPRRESIDYDLATLGDTAVLVAEYDRLTPHTQASIVTLDTVGPTSVATPPVDISDPDWGYYYPRIAAGSESYGMIYRGDVEGTRRLLLSVVRP